MRVLIVLMHACMHACVHARSHTLTHVCAKLTLMRLSFIHVYHRISRTSHCCTYATRYGIHLSPATVNLITMDWEHCWLEAWSKQRTEVLQAARKKAGTRRSTMSFADVDTHACRYVGVCFISLSLFSPRAFFTFSPKFDILVVISSVFLSRSLALALALSLSLALLMGIPPLTLMQVLKAALTTVSSIIFWPERSDWSTAPSHWSSATLEGGTRVISAMALVQ